MSLKRTRVRKHARTTRSGRRYTVQPYFRYTAAHRAALRAAEGRPVHLYSNPAERKKNLRSFEERYGAAKGKRVYGAVVGKVRREQAAAGTRSRVERVGAHRSTSRTGNPEWVRGHRARIA